VARILILENHPDVRDLIVHVVERVGHEPVLSETEDVDAVLLEPASRSLFEIAHRIRAQRPATPVVCVSIGPPSAASTSLDPALHVLKPFSLAELKQALVAAVG
jgi:DNA-binding response OmpR family regulator